MSDNNVLRVGTTVDLAGLQSGMPQAAALVEQNVSRIVDSFGRTQQASTAASGAVVASAGQIRQSVDISAESIKAFAEAMKGAHKQSQETASGWEGFADKVKGSIEHPLDAAAGMAKKLLMDLGPVGAVAVGAAAGLAELGKQAFDLVNEEGAAARQTQNLANRLGMTYEEAKRLDMMARIVDTDIGSLARAAFKLSDALQDPSGKEAKELRKLGVTATETGPAMLQVLQNLAHITSATERMAKARELLGRAAVSLQPVIADYDRLQEVVAKLDNNLSEESVNGLISTREKIKELSTAWSEMKETLAAKLSPLVRVIVEVVKSGVQGTVAAPNLPEKTALENASADKLFGNPELAARAGRTGAIAIMNAAEGGLQLARKSSDALVAASGKWKAGYEHSIDGLKKALEKSEEEHKKLGATLQGPGNFNTTDAAAYAKLTKDIATQKEQIKAAEKAESGQGVAERNAIAGKVLEEEKKLGMEGVAIFEANAKQKFQLDQITQAQLTAAELAASKARYEIEVEYAHKEDALKASTARAEHKASPSGSNYDLMAAERMKRDQETIGKQAVAQKKADDAMDRSVDAAAERQAKSAERTAEQSLKFLERNAEEWKKQNEDVAHINEQAEMAHATRVFEFNRDRIEEQFKAHQIDAKKRIELLMDIEMQEYKTQLAGAEGERDSHPANSPGYAQGQEKVDAINDKMKASSARLNNDWKLSMNQWQQTAHTAIGSVSNAFTGGMNGWLSHQKSFGAAMVDSFRQMADQFIVNQARMAAQVLVSFAIQEMLGKKTIMHNAAQAASKAWNAAGDLPFPANVIVGAASAASVFGSVMTLGSFDQGGIVPRTQMALVHGGERVLTQDQTSRFESAMAAGGRGGGEGGVQNHYHAAVGESPDSVTRNAAAYQRAMRDGRRFA